MREEAVTPPAVLAEGLGGEGLHETSDVGDEGGLAGGVDGLEERKVGVEAEGGTRLPRGRDAEELLRGQSDRLADGAVLVVERATRGHQHLEAVHATIQEDQHQRLVVPCGRLRSWRWHRRNGGGQQAVAQRGKGRRVVDGVLQSLETLARGGRVVLGREESGGIAPEAATGEEDVHVRDRLGLAAGLREEEVAVLAAIEPPEAHAAAGDAVPSEGVHEVDVGHDIGHREDLELRADHASGEALGMELRVEEAEDVRGAEGPLADCALQVTKLDLAVPDVLVLHGPHEVQDLQERCPQGTNGSAARAGLRVQQDCGRRGPKVSILTGVRRAVEDARAEGRLDLVHVRGRGVGLCQVLDQAVGYERRCVLVVEEVVEKGLNLVKGLLRLAVGPQREGRRVPELVALQLHLQVDILVEVPSALQDRVLVPDAVGRIGLDLPTAAEDAGRGRREGAHLQPGCDRRPGGRKLGEDGDLRGRGRAAAGRAAVRRAPGGARPGVVLHREAGGAPLHRELELLGHVVPVHADLSIKVHNDLHGARVGGPHEIPVVATAGVAGPSLADVHAVAGAPVLGLGVGHLLPLVRASVLRCPIALGAVPSVVAGPRGCAALHAVQRLHPVSGVLAPGTKEPAVYIPDVCAGEAVVGYPRVRIVRAALAAVGPRGLRGRRLQASHPHRAVPVSRVGCHELCPTAGVPVKRVDADGLLELVEAVCHLEDLRVRGRALRALAQKRGIELDGPHETAGRGCGAAEFGEERGPARQDERVVLHVASALEGEPRAGRQEAPGRQVPAKRVVVSKVAPVQVGLGVDVVPRGVHLHGVQQVPRPA
mmetsp:Transcript_114668/g.357142  ORF Transcript_114668/g.357142 Transcript_114668/m.357142 type:complete len:824 (+) Transcript_114668:1026-3497(+)